MRVIELMCLFDDWNKFLIISDDNLNHILDGEKVFEVYDKKEKYEDILNKDVVSFGFYDDDFCIRVKQGYKLKYMNICVSAVDISLYLCYNIIRKRGKQYENEANRK